MLTQELRKSAQLEKTPKVTLTLMQMWKSTDIIDFTLKWYAEGNASKHRLLSVQTYYNYRMC